MFMFPPFLADPPEFVITTSPQHTQLIAGAPFTLNCTPSAANPPVNMVSIQVDGSPVISGDNVTVTDNVLTIPSVQRSHSGNYSCTATNTVGSAVTYSYLLVVGVLCTTYTVAVQTSLYTTCVHEIPALHSLHCSVHYCHVYSCLCFSVLSSFTPSPYHFPFILHPNTPPHTHTYRSPQCTSCCSCI